MYCSMSRWVSKRFGTTADAGGCGGAVLRYAELAHPNSARERNRATRTDRRRIILVQHKDTKTQRHGGFTWPSCLGVLVVKNSEAQRRGSVVNRVRGMARIEPAPSLKPSARKRRKKVST